MDHLLFSSPLLALFSLCLSSTSEGSCREPAVARGKASVATSAVAPVVVEPVGGVAADDQSVLVFVADDVEGGLALLFLGRGGRMSEQVLQVHQYLLDPGQTVVVVA